MAAIQIVGDPGIGKTTLLEDLAEIAADDRSLVLSGRAAEFERDLPFGVFVDALDGHLHSLGRNDLRGLEGENQSELAAVFPAIEAHHERLRIAETERFRLHRAVRSLLEHLAAGRGLVLILDDLHWADPASCELIASLLRRAPDAAVLLAFAYRSHQLSGTLALELAASVRAGTTTDIDLGPLTRSEAAELVLEERLSGTVGDALFAESGGNPFYLQQLARARRSAGQPSAGGIAERGAGVALAAEIPADVARALAAELGMLSGAAEAVAQAAAVAGEPFEPDIVAEIAGMTESDALAALDELLDRRLVHPSAIPRQFRFRHPLVRHGVYGSIKGGWRIAAHARAAAALSARGAAAVVCAPHVEQSARAGDQQAIELLVEAAAASSGRAPATSARWLEAALRLVPERGPPARSARSCCRSSPPRCPAPGASRLATSRWSKRSRRCPRRT